MPCIICFASHSCCMMNRSQASGNGDEEGAEGAGAGEQARGDGEALYVASDSKGGECGDATIIEGSDHGYTGDHDVGGVEKEGPDGADGADGSGDDGVEEKEEGNDVADDKEGGHLAAVKRAGHLGSKSITTMAVRRHCAVAVLYKLCTARDE